jgi:hypothetical protein
MKNLVLGSLIALTATQAAGCIITSGEEDAYITANWTFRNEATDTPTGCPGGFDTVALYNQEVTGDGSFIGAPIIDLFNCAANSGVSAPLPPALFLSWIEVTDHNNTSVYAKSTSAYVDVTVSDKSFSAQILNDGGYFEFSWALKGASSNTALSCDQAGVGGGKPKGIQLQAFVSGSSASAQDIFDCADGHGITAGYVAGNYDVLIDALSPDPVGSAPTITSSIAPKNVVTSLGTVTIPINGL